MSLLTVPNTPFVAQDPIFKRWLSTLQRFLNDTADSVISDHTLLSNIGNYTHPQIDSHLDDASKHFIESAINHTNIQNVGTVSHSALDSHVADNTIHFSEGSVDHLNIANIGTNTHAAIDTHIADGTLHFTKASIDHTAIQNIGTNTHAQIDTHIADSTIHFPVAGAINEIQYNDGSDGLAASSDFTYTDSSKTLNVDKVNADTIEHRSGYTPTGSEIKGTTFWDEGNRTLTTALGNDVFGQHFKEAFIDGQNDTGATIPNGTPVEYAGSIGNSGNFRITQASASSAKPSFMFVGLLTESTDDGDTGKITTRGKVRGVQTNGANYGETWAAGEIIYLSETTGELTNVAPNAPAPAIVVALVISAHANNGTLEVRVSFPEKLDDLSDVNGNPPADLDLLQWDATGGVWDRVTPSNVVTSWTRTGTTISPTTGTDDVDITSTTASTSTTTGALTVAGGVGITQNAYIGNKLDVADSTVFHNDATLDNDKYIKGEDTGGTSRRLIGVNGSNNVVVGSFGGSTLNQINFQLAQSSNEVLFNTTAFRFNESNNDRDFIVRKNTAGEAIDYDAGLDTITLGSVTNVTDTTASTSTTTGALTVAGGVGVIGKINAGNNITSESAGTDAREVVVKNTAGEFGFRIATNGSLSFRNNGTSTPILEATTTADKQAFLVNTNRIDINPDAENLDVRLKKQTSGEAMLYDAGLDTLDFGSQTGITDTTAATSSTTGALTVAGGVGIAGATYMGGLLDLGGNNLQLEGANYSFRRVSNEIHVYVGGINTLQLETQNNRFIKPLTVPLGSVSSTGVRFSGDSNTGFYSPGADQMDMVAGGAIGASFSTTNVNVPLTTASTSTTTGALTVAGGVGIAGNTYNGGDLHIPSDTKKIFLGASDDISLEYDGTDAKIITDLQAPSDFVVDCGTEKTLRLEEVVYDDLPPATFSNAKIPPANAPTWTAFLSGGSIDAYRFDVNDYLFVSPIEVLHKYKEGTDFSVHLHWATGQGTDGTDRTVQWEVIYTIANGDSAFSAETTITGEETIPASTAANTHLITGIGTISGTGFKIGTYIIARVRRIASTGTEPSNDPYGLALGVHVMQDTMGSRQLFVK